MPVRHRYILTRGNRLRLRYTAAPAFMMVLCAGGAFMLSAQTAQMTQQGARYNDVVASAGAAKAGHAVGDDLLDEESMNSLYAAMQRRLKRYGAVSDEADAADLYAAVTPPTPPERPSSRTITIGSGDTLAGVLQKKAGLSGKAAHEAVVAMQKHANPRAIRPGQVIEIHYDPTVAHNSQYEELASLRMDLDALKTVTLTKGPEGAYSTALEEKETIRKFSAHSAEIELSLYGSGLKAGVPSTILADTIRIYSWDIDFQRDIRRGDALDVLFESYETEDGTHIKSGDILYARLNINGQDIPVYRYETKDGRTDYFGPDGKSIRKALLSTPIDGARLSSGFGHRKHPVLGYTKLHKGVDFAAPRGTPIYAAGDGVIEKIGPFSSYGNYVRIRHNSSFKTAYAHMHNFAKGLSNGSRVKQGQVIGYVGTTGRSTGPHLHYEVLENNVHINPRAARVPQGESLSGKELADFKAHIKNIDRQFQQLKGGSAKYAALQNGTASRLR